jgi:AI-2 transport system ATP-binding protein
MPIGKQESTTVDAENSHLVELRNISKAFGGIPVLKNVTLHLRRGIIHGLVGGNGAGKSTLMKILSGVYTCDKGDMSINGQNVKFKRPSDAHARGIYLVPQEPGLFPYLTIKENVLLGLGSTLKDPVLKIRSIMEALGCDFALDQIGADLTIAKQQQVELIRGLARECCVIILDEPTSALTSREVEALFDMLKRLKNEKNICFVYITHRLNELFDIVDELTVLQNGAIISQGPINNYTLKKVIQLMVPAGNDNGEWENTCAPSSSGGDDEAGPKEGSDYILEVNNLSGRGFFNVSLNLRCGEILGVTGVVGSGRTEFAESVAGIRKAFDGTVTLEGKKFSPLSPQDSIRQGVAYLPEDRHLHGCFLEGTVKENISSSALHRLFKFIIRKKIEVDLAKTYTRTLHILTPGYDSPAKYLSGGNQQKMVFGKCLAVQPKVLILDEPTRGIDANARKEIYASIRQFARQGVSIILISSDFEEIKNLSHRVFIMYQGRTVNELRKPNITLENITFSSFGYRAGADEAETDQPDIKKA